MGEGPLNKLKRSPQTKTDSDGSLRLTNAKPEAFVFCERASGAVRFQVKATEEGTVPVEWAAGLLAMHCVVRGQKPDDYRVLVVPSQGLPASVCERASELLEASRVTLGSPANVTRRESEVLECVLKHKSNKEIGNVLHLSERTIKFHISSLLAKFGARDRVDLMCKAAVGLLPASAAPPESLFGFPVRATLSEESEQPPTEERSVPNRKPLLASAS
jgi:DNA-binding CsgD family transcriptional regulator